MTILDSIITNKKHEVFQRKELYPIKLLEKNIYYSGPIISLRKYLDRENYAGIIAEIKRSSPSAGVLQPNLSVEKLSIGYMQAGASALSILTDEKYFQGTLKDLIIARKNNLCPILRKDFIIDEYQLIESKSYGADVVLLIAKVISPKEFKNLATAARNLGLEVLLELHKEDDLSLYDIQYADLIGINARNLSSLAIEHEFVFEAPKLLSDTQYLIAESGIKDTQSIKELKNIGYKGFLIGESFLRKSDPALACKSFIDAIGR